MTTRSDGVAGPVSVLKTSRINRLALFLTTAPPSLLLATMPSRDCRGRRGRSDDGEIAAVSPAPGVEDALEFPAAADAPRGWQRVRLALSGVRNREPLATLRATALQDLPALLGRHPDQEAVGLLAVPTVRLKCTFALGHDCETSGAELAERRNLDSSEPGRSSVNCRWRKRYAIVRSPRARRTRNSTGR